MREPLNQPNPKHRYVNNMFDRIAKRYDLMNTLMTAGLHRRWRRKAIELAAPPKGGLSLDVGCGTGVLGTFLRSYASALEGIDLSPDMIAVARQSRLYDRLLEGDFTDSSDMMHQPYDILILAAVAIHFSTLDVIFEKSTYALEENGLLALTIFVNNRSDDFSIDSAGYFSHNVDYVKRLATTFGFALLRETCGTHEIRDSQSVPGAGLVFLRNPCT